MGWNSDRIQFEEICEHACWMHYVAWHDHFRKTLSIRESIQAYVYSSTYKETAPSSTTTLC
jgi:hypothetical protein